MENSYLDEAWNNSPYHNVYGFKLRPFCLYYQHLLQSVRSPVLVPHKMFDASQLFLAAEICSQPFSREGYTMDRLLSRNFIGRLRRVRNQGRILTCSFKEQARRWNVYFSDYLALAEKWEDTGEEYDEFGQVLSSKKSNPRKDLERVMATAAFLVSETHWPEEHVMMMPLGKTYSWSDYFAIQKGAKFSFKTQAEQEAIERDKARIAREREEQAVQRN